MGTKLDFPRMFTGKERTNDFNKCGGLPGEAPPFFCHSFCGRLAVISGAGESPRERLSVGTDHPDSDEHNTRE
jgi:hypothetical protein